jgi:hypothetical protein
MRGKKKYPAAKYIGKKISCAALLQEKNIYLVSPGGKKLLHSLNLPTPPQKSNGPPLMSLHWVIVIVWLG